MLKLLPAYINEGIKIWFYVCKAVFLKFPFAECLAAKRYKGEDEFILEMANFFDFNFGHQPDEFISVAADRRSRS